jgi:hypothetical protein
MAMIAAERRRKKAKTKAAKKDMAKATNKELHFTLALPRCAHQKRKKARDAKKNLKQRRRRWPPVVSPPCGTEHFDHGV